ncbi:response regulator [Chelativorans sp. M5D2P16]|uniref:response regulator n=1 Tax=Chelativorans sp. M5D2P16 TaxID=3095678 RepID=UPI002ACA508F|nr:response regulator [Chelativorans sp. M5D2P16]MDZ5697928.1 response regulator [Chelativorans sp. M5D2P16]
MKRCLIVDDSSVIRKVAKRILAGPEMLVGEAATAYEAIEICSHEMPDVAVVDSMLPDMDSVELIQRLMALEAAVKPRLLLCTCELDLGRIMRAKRAGARGYVMKPFTRPQLLESFREHRLAA